MRVFFVTCALCVVVPVLAGYTNKQKRELTNFTYTRAEANRVEQANDEVAKLQNQTFKEGKETFLAMPKKFAFCFQDTIPQPEVGLCMLVGEISQAKTEQEKNELNKKLYTLLKGRKSIDALFHRILTELTMGNAEDLKTLEHTYQTTVMDIMPCYKTLVDGFLKTCVKHQILYDLTRCVKGGDVHCYEVKAGKLPHTTMFNNGS